MNLKIVVSFLVVISFVVSGNLLMKSGAMLPQSDKFLFGLLSWRSVFGLAFFGTAAIIYAWLLKWVPLNIAQSILAGQFVLVILASAVIFSEPIAGMRWIGIALIAIGIVWVGWT